MLQKQKSSSDKSDELSIFSADIFELGLTYLPDHTGMELAPFPGTYRDRLSRLHRAITLCLS